MIRAPDDATPSRAGVGLSGRAWLWACVLLVVLTWAPVFALHVRNMSVADPGAGTLIAVFPWTSSTRDVFRSIGEAKGTPVSPVGWIPRAWVVQSGEAGFAGRLRERGALGVYSPNLLSMRQVLSCSGMVTPPPSAGSGPAT
ncbi:MAG TPA: hypothetical protein VFK92_15400 [Burkholderiales bacterium]|nr:hypothetical protein [Burkholderiales bacterium]